MGSENTVAGINIDVAVNSKAAIGGVKDLGAALDDTADSLDDLTRESQQAARASDKALDQTADSADDASKGVDGLTRNFRDLTHATQRQDDAADKAARSSSKSFKDAGGATGEFKDEALANFSEVTSSFDGSMTSVVDLAQGTFGGLASLGGPVGLALGGLAALLGGVFNGLATGADENAKAAAQSIEDMYSDMAESGEEFVSQDYVNQKIQEIIGNQDQLNRVRQEAVQAAISEQTALRAEAGDHDALNKALEGAIAKRKELSDRIDEVVMNGGKVSGELSSQADAAQNLVLHYQDLQNNTDTAKAKADLYRSSINETAAAMSSAGGSADALRGKLDAFHDINVKVNVDDAVAREVLRQLGKAINVDMFVTTRTGRGVN